MCVLPEFVEPQGFTAILQILRPTNKVPLPVILTQAASIAGRVQAVIFAHGRRILTMAVFAQRD